ncbi:hypothetical protein J1N35_001238, partial [Gossypium stocksii]
IESLQESCGSAKPIIYRLEDMFISQVDLARESTITRLMNAQKKLHTLIKDHMRSLMTYFTKAEDNGVELDLNTQIEVTFKILLKDFNDFSVNK